MVKYEIEIEIYEGEAHVVVLRDDVWVMEDETVAVEKLTELMERIGREIVDEIKRWQP
ncbi:hypothetical protein PABY_08360 [Pyrodictium abyssi]|uniref:Uncharacterized protein n=1 Tax=Pyrodictium abyssi TaxID=54256 RepID=A0ABN6ZPD6_9CREN|nr:hypothetical protein PABY_08360 [Pyrodictium abyssi]